MILKVLHVHLAMRRALSRRDEQMSGQRQFPEAQGGRFDKGLCSWSKVRHTHAPIRRLRDSCSKSSFGVYDCGCNCTSSGSDTLEY